MSNKRTRFIGGLAVAILLPLTFFIIMKIVTKGSLRMTSYYVIDKIDTQRVNGKVKYDTIYHQTADLRLTNQLGQQISLNKDLPGKLIVIDFFYVNCPDVCTRLTNNMKLLQKAFKKNDTTIQLVSITVDPEHDSFPALRAYADSFQVDHDKWWFLTGNKESIYNFAINELHLPIRPGEGKDNFIHDEKLVLLDRDRNIRGYYNGLDSADIKRCADDIVLVTFENKHNKRHALK